MNQVKLDTKELDKIAKQLNIKREAVCRRFAFQVEGLAKQMAKKKTGALRNSIYTVTKREDGYAKASSETKSARPDVDTAQHPTPTGNIIANVGPCVEYAEYVEFGTSKMGAQPYLTPAVEQIAKRYNDGDEWKELVE